MGGPETLKHINDLELGGVDGQLAAAAPYLLMELVSVMRALDKSIEEGLSYLESVFHERGGVDDKLSDWEKEFRDEIEKARGSR